MLTITEKDNGSTINLKVNETLSIQLIEAATTGYLWEVEKNTLTSEIRIEEKFLPPGTNAQGAAGKKIFQIEALKQGSGTLVLKYWQKWEGDVDSRFTIHLNIQSN